MHLIISDISNPVNLQQYIDNRDGFKRVGLKSLRTAGVGIIFTMKCFKKKVRLLSAYSLGIIIFSS